MSTNPEPHTTALTDGPCTSPAISKSARVALAFGWSLAIGASMLSLAVSGLVGWQRGGTQAVQILLAAIGILAVLGAHWLLPLLRAVQAGIVTWLIGILLWLACLVYAATSHADFFIDVQAQRADHRIAGMASETLATAIMPKRRLPAILEEEADVRVKWMQSRFAEASCETNCETFRIRQVALKSRIAALEAEEEEARRWQVTQDQLHQRKEALRDDPVASRLLRDFGATRAVASAVTVLPAAVILEGLGSLCWFLVLLQGRARPVTRPVMQPVTSRVTGAADGPADASPMTEPVVPVVTTSVELQPDEDAIAVSRHDDAPALRDVQALAAKVWVEIQQGQVRPTVSGIRAHLGIAQQQARAIARVIRGWQAAATSG